jgi:hypothetical protein
MPLRKAITGDYAKEILRKHGALAAKICRIEVHPDVKARAIPDLRVRFASAS